MFAKLVNAIEVVALIGVVAFVAGLFIYSPPAEPPLPGWNEDAGGEAAAPDGSVIYEARCARCHGAEGEGRSGYPTLAGEVASEFPDVADQIALVTEGRNVMPGFGGDLTPEQIEAVVDYTRTDLGT